MIRNTFLFSLTIVLSLWCLTAHAQTPTAEPLATPAPVGTVPIATLPRCVLDYYSLQIKDRFGVTQICSACEEYKPWVKALGLKYPIVETTLNLIKSKKDERIQWAMKHGGIKYFFPAVIVWYVKDKSWTKVYSANFPFTENQVEAGINKCLEKLAPASGAAEDPGYPSN